MVVVSAACCSPTEGCFGYGIIFAARACAGVGIGRDFELVGSFSSKPRLISPVFGTKPGSVVAATLSPAKAAAGVGGRAKSHAGR